MPLLWILTEVALLPFMLPFVKFVFIFLNHVVVAVCFRHVFLLKNYDLERLKYV